MEHRFLIPAAFLGVVLLGGCVATKPTTKPPTISHVHIGHTLTGWTSTPDRRGLLDVAEEEAGIAQEHARYAVEAATQLNLIKEHVGHVLHAIDPKLLAQGPGLGFGLRPALAGAVNHVGYAAESDDASANIKAFNPSFAEMGAAVERRIALVVGLAEVVMATSSVAEAEALAAEILKLATAFQTGTDEDGDGSIEIAEAGLSQIRREIEAAVAREVPPYAAFDNSYLFNLTRSSSGRWSFQQTGEGGSGGSDGGGGSGSY